MPRPRAFRGPVAEESFAGYEAVAGEVAFEMTFDQETELTGFMKLRLWVEARGADDMDLIVTVQKADAEGNVVPTLSTAGPHPGVSGVLRASRRELDEDRSAAYQPVHTPPRAPLPRRAPPRPPTPAPPPPAAGAAVYPRPALFPPPSAPPPPPIPWARRP